MADPTPKNPLIRALLDDLTKSAFGRTSTEAITGNVCTRCGKQVTDADFTDDVSRQEYRITGLCQECQDWIFVQEDNDGE